MKKYCGNCEAFHEANEIKEAREYTIKGAKIKAEITILTCYHCGEEIYDKDNEIKNDIIMFDEYKKINGLLTSKDIIDIRDKYHLSQSALSKLLGFGEKTITRYENGAIQDRAHDNLLRVLFLDDAFSKLWLVNIGYLTQKENDKITSAICKSIATPMKYEIKSSALVYNTIEEGNGVFTYEGCK